MYIHILLIIMFNYEPIIHLYEEMTKIICFRNLYLLVITLFLQLLSGSSFPVIPDDHFGGCISKKCGDVNISYPFHILGQQESYCGYPGFEVSCKDDSLPYLNISGGNYVIRNISYEDETIQVINPVLMESLGNETACSGSLQHLNLTLDSDLFQYTSTPNDVLLLLNCPSKVLQEVSRNMVVCGSVAVYQNDTELRDLEGKCSGVVAVPYEGETKNASNIKETLSQGFSLKWLAKDCSACVASGGQCGYDQTANEPICFCPDLTHVYQCFPAPVSPTNIRPTNSNARRRKLVIIGSVSGSAGLVILVLVVVIICNRERVSGNILPILRMEGIRENQNVEAFLKSYGTLAPKRYRYAEVKKITNSFKEKLGEGGFGSVYKGKLHDGRFVAVKKLNEMKGDGEDFINEVVSISRTNHVNVVTLLGFCLEGRKRALIYEFLVKGSLDKFVYSTRDQQALDWQTLFKIAIGIARGLNYLHRGCNTRILHFDIKPHNILLDEEFHPKISDFGLAKLCPTKDSTISVLEARGTIGYIAPEVFFRNFGGVSHKSDVYSYGMMVLDLACGRKSISRE